MKVECKWNEVLESGRGQSGISYLVLKRMTYFFLGLLVINADNGFLDVVALARVSNLVFVEIRVGDGVADVNDEDELEAGICIGLNMIEVWLPLSQKMIYIGPVSDRIVFVVMILCPEMICTGVVVGIFVIENVNLVVHVAVLIDVDESNVFVKGDVVLFLEIRFV